VLTPRGFLHDSNFDLVESVLRTLLARTGGAKTRSNYAPQGTGTLHGALPGVRWKLTMAKAHDKSPTSLDL
jgi:hypothetical protein